MVGCAFQVSATNNLSWLLPDLVFPIHIFTEGIVSAPFSIGCFFVYPRCLLLILWLSSLLLCLTLSGEFWCHSVLLPWGDYFFFRFQYFAGMHLFPYSSLFLFLCPLHLVFTLLPNVPHPCPYLQLFFLFVHFNEGWSSVKCCQAPCFLFFTVPYFLISLLLIYCSKRAMYHVIWVKWLPVHHDGCAYTMDSKHAYALAAILE